MKVRGLSNRIVSWPIAVLLASSCALLSTPAFGIPNAISATSESALASDAFAAAHLVLIFTVFLGFAIFALVLYRRSRSPNREREFIEELQEEELRSKDDRKKLGAGPEAEESLEPWEKPGEWWRKG